MSLTPNFGFNIPTGTDTVNLLTQCYPNFTSLDTILQAVKESGVSTATATKSGITHQIVRTVTDCDVFRFIATANYTSGDLFTVDGSPVTATAVNGTALPTGAFVINQSVLCILNGSVLTVDVAGSSDAGDVAYDNTGSGLTASNVQAAIDEVVSDIPTGFAATAISYDNTVSGLTATNAQAAIDELANSGGGNDHGLYELWVNPTPSANFVAQTIQIPSTRQYDALIIATGYTVNEQMAPMLFEIDQLRFGSPSIIQIFTFTGLNTATPASIVYVSRNVTITYDAVNERYDVEFTAGSNFTKATNSTSAVTATTDNARVIPFRIYGVIHNN